MIELMEFCERNSLYLGKRSGKYYVGNTFGINWLYELEDENIDVLYCECLDREKLLNKYDKDTILEVVDELAINNYIYLRMDSNDFVLAILSKINPERTRRLAFFGEKEYNELFSIIETLYNDYLHKSSNSLV